LIEIGRAALKIDPSIGSKQSIALERCRGTVESTARGVFGRDCIQEETR